MSIGVKHVAGPIPAESAIDAEEPLPPPEDVDDSFEWSPCRESIFGPTAPQRPASDFGGSRPRDSYIGGSSLCRVATGLSVIVAPRPVVEGPRLWSRHCQIVWIGAGHGGLQASAQAPQGALVCCRALTASIVFSRRALVTTLDKLLCDSAAAPTQRPICTTAWRRGLSSRFMLVFRCVAGHMLVSYCRHHPLWRGRMPRTLRLEFRLLKRHDNVSIDDIITSPLPRFTAGAAGATESVCLPRPERLHPVAQCLCRLEAGHSLALCVVKGKLLENLGRFSHAVSLLWTGWCPKAG